MLQIEINCLGDRRVVLPEFGQRSENLMPHDLAQIAEIDRLFLRLGSDTFGLELSGGLFGWEALKDALTAYEAHVHAPADIAARVNFFVNREGLFESHKSGVTRLCLTHFKEQP